MNADWRDRLAAYDDECLDPGERAELDRLLDDSAEARDYLAALRRDREAFRSAFAQITASPTFVDAVMTRLPQRRAWLPLPRLLEVCAAALFVFVVGSLIAPGRQIERQRQLRCQRSVKQLTQAFLSYAEDYDGHLPDATSWMVQVGEHHRTPLDYLCPSDPNPATGSYGMPMGLSGADLRGLSASQVLLFDAEGLFPAPRHDRRANVGQIDGSVYLATEDRLWSGR